MDCSEDLKPQFTNHRKEKGRFKRRKKSEKETERERREMEEEEENEAYLGPQPAVNG